MKLISELAAYLAPAYPAFISLTGGGGKTTTLTALGHFFKDEGKSVLITTTTRIQGPKGFKYDADYAFTAEDEVLSHMPSSGELVYYAERNLMDPKKMTSPRMEVLEILSRRYDVIIAEADGARCLPLKLHTERDPVIPEITTATLAIMGATAFGGKGDNVCFGYEGEEIVDSNFLNMLIENREGVLKRAKGKTLILVNQCDAVSADTIRKLKDVKAPCPVMLGSVREDQRYV